MNPNRLTIDELNALPENRVPSAAEQVHIDARNNVAAELAGARQHLANLERGMLGGAREMVLRVARERLADAERAAKSLGIE